MDAFAEKMGVVGAWCGNNKYLSAVKNAFQNYMPATISGAIGVLWTSVLVNESTGLGSFFSPIMVLEPLNSVFTALNTATIGMITIGVTCLLAQEIADANGEQTGAFPAVLGFMMLMMVTPASMTEGETTFAGIPTSYLGATGLFTGLLVGILGTECYCALRHVDALKIKMPEQVPPGVARSFEILVPTCIVLIIVGLVGWCSEMFLGMYLNDLIFTYVQGPISAVVGGNIVGVCIMYVIIMLFWCVGIHGNNMVSAVKESIFTPLLLANTAEFESGVSAYNVSNVFTITSLQMFGEWGGSGCTIGLIIAIFIFSKRSDNRTIASISIVPGLFNINETMTFGIPLVINPVLDIPFILTPVACQIVGWILVLIGFCPKCVIQAPWTTPPILFGFIATGGNVMGAISQIIVMAVGTVIYIPFFIAYERQQNKESAEA